MRVFVVFNCLVPLKFIKHMKFMKATPCFFAQIDLQAEEIVQTVDEHPTKTADHAKGNDHQLLRKTMKTKPFGFFENRSVAKVKIPLA